MKSFRTSIVVATAAFALSWAGVSNAEDDANVKQGATTKTQSTSGTTDTTGTAPVDTSGTPSTPSTGTDTTIGIGSDSADGTGYGTTQPSQPSQPYQQTQQQPAEQQPVQAQAQTYGTTTTTAGNYNANYNPNAGAENDGWIHRPNRPLLYTGLGILVGTYATSAIVASQSNKDEDKRLYIPVVGPWLDLGQRDCGLFKCDATEDRNQALLIGSGVLQGVGTILTISSFFAREENVSPPSAAAVRAKSTAAAKPKVHLTPMNMRGGGGFGAMGTF